MVAKPKPVLLYHIMHVDDLASIIQKGGLFSDSEIRKQNITHKVIGYNHIKERRLCLPVNCHQGTMVGNYVPFYFCPRSPMLYVIYKQNPELTYNDGQEQIVHLVANMDAVVQWADEQNIRWAFSTSNAGSPLADFYADVTDLDKINWDAVNSQYWSKYTDQKQAEFLVYGFFPFHLFHEIATINAKIKSMVNNFVSCLNEPPNVNIHRNWYY